MSTTVKGLSEAIKTAATEVAASGDLYVKFTSGLMIQGIKISMPVLPAGDYGDTTFEWPVAFSSAPAASFAIKGTDSYWSKVVGAIEASSTGGTMHFWNNGDGTANPNRKMSCDIIAIGK